MFGFSPVMMASKAGFDPATPIGTFIEGGYYLGTITDGGVNYAIIAAPRPEGHSASTMQWGGYGITTGLTSRTNGLGNTEALVASSTSYPAAEFCAGLTLNGFDDWHLPAIDELVRMYRNRTYLPAGQSFNSASYWTSTEDSSNYARILGFSSGDDGRYNKSSNFPVRAVRRVPIT